MCKHFILRLHVGDSVLSSTYNKEQLDLAFLFDRHSCIFLWNFMSLRIDNGEYDISSYL